MTNRKLVKRIITCQGSIQLVTALSVLSYRETEQRDLGYEYENYLLIYGLYSPPEQIDAFAAFIKKMAEFVCNWKAIIYLSADWMNDITEQLKDQRHSDIFQRVYKLIGAESVDEIYLSRNWQLSNQLLINAYHSAEKICYGDSIGIYFSSNSRAFYPESFQLYLEAKIKSMVNTIRKKLHLRKYLKTIEFDIGYFVLPNVMGESPPMKTIIIDKKILLETFQKLSGLVERKYLTDFRHKVSDASVWILLTSNFSEANRMSLENEIAAYRQLLISQKIDKNAILVIKPHPRDDKNKIKKLSSSLSDIFAKNITLSEPSLFFLPFEVFFFEAFLRSNLTLSNQVKVFAVSSACLSLKLLYAVPSIVGFGEQITPQVFYKDFVAGRLEHETKLRAAVKNIEHTVINTN